MTISYLSATLSMVLRTSKKTVVAGAMVYANFIRQACVYALGQASLSRLSINPMLGIKPWMQGYPHEAEPSPDGSIPGRHDYRLHTGRLGTAVRFPAGRQPSSVPYGTADWLPPF